MGYILEKTDAHPITTVESTINLGGNTCFIHNTTSGKVFYGLKPNEVDSKKWELAADDVHGPIAVGNLYIKGQVTGTLKVLYVKGV